LKFVKKKEHLFAVALYGALSLLFFNEILLQTHWFGEDFFTQNYPNRVFASDELRRGKFPLWNPFCFSGTPFFADIQTAVLYPPNLLMSFWSLTSTWGYYALEIKTILHFLVGAWFMFAYLRLSGIIFIGAFLGGIFFSFSGYLFNHAHHSNYVDSGIWLPAVFYCCLKSFRGNPYWILGCPAIIAMSLLAGHPQLALFIFYAFTAYYFYLAWHEKCKVKTIFGVYLILTFLIGLMAMVQLLPLVEFLTNTQRQSLGYEGAVKDSLPIKAVWTFLFSELGNPFYEPWQQWEFRCYFGLGGLALAILGSIQKRYNLIFFIALAAISLVLAFGENTPFYKGFFHFLPGLKFVRVPARFLFLFLFCASVLAAHGMSALVEGTRTSRFERAYLRKCVLGLGLFFITVGITAVSWFNLNHPGLKAHLIFYLILTILLMTALVGSLNKKKGFICQFLILAIVIADLFIFRGGFCLTPSSKENLSLMLKQNPVAQIAELVNKGERIQMRNAFPLFKNYGMVHRVANTSGYNPFTLAVYSNVDPFKLKSTSFMGVRYMDYIDTEGLLKNATGPVKIKQLNGFFINDNAGPMAFMTANYKVDPDFSLKEGFKDNTFDPYRIVYLEKQLAAQSLTKPLKYRITNYQSMPGEITLSVQSSSPGLLMTTKIAYPGWKVFINNHKKESLRANGAFRAVYVDEISATVKFQYRPWSFYLGVIISSMVFLGCFIFVIFNKKLRRLSES
tara:strand:+ start:324 stop:2522 length:2199 start_codon:yes stop_codon:yes gene_type:complete